jgi:hypothetical protein
MPKNAIYNTCEKCNFTCFKKSNWETHLVTSKHVRNHTETQNNPEETTPEPLVCKLCDKEYSSRSGLWKHSKTCKPEDKDVIIKQSQLDFLVRETAEMKNFLSTQIENLSILLREKQLTVNSE